MNGELRACVDSRRFFVTTDLKNPVTTVAVSLHPYVIILAKSTFNCCAIGEPMDYIRAGFRGSSLGSLEPPFQTLTELADTYSLSLKLRSAVQSRQIAQT